MSNKLAEKEAQKKMIRADQLYNLIEKKTDGDTMSLINELIDLNIELERDCNQ